MSVTPNQLLEKVQSLLQQYPEYGDNPILVEDEHGVLDLMHVTSVEGLNGQLELIIDSAEPDPKARTRHLGDLNFTKQPE